MDPRPENAPFGAASQRAHCSRDESATFEAAPIQSDGKRVADPRGRGEGRPAAPKAVPVCDALLDHQPFNR
jgi:hypothetical protein